MKPTLYMSLRSPFARRVRLAMEELGLAYETEVVDVFNLPLGYRQINPLGRVPALRLANQEMIVDSWMILDYLRSRHENHPLFLTGGASEIRARTLSGLAVGVMEHTVAGFLETLRPPGLVYPPMCAEYLDVVHAGLAALEESAPGGSTFLLGSELRLCDLDVGTATAYCEVRVGRDVLVGYPRLRAHLALLNGRESFRKTVPPA